jgi:hypothetical protein
LFVGGPALLKTDHRQPDGKNAEKNDDWSHSGRTMRLLGPEGEHEISVW